MPPRIIYDYREYGFTVRSSNDLSPCEICLDVGNAFVEGVVDHHHLRPHIKRQAANIFGSTTNMLKTLLLLKDSDPEPWHSAADTKRRIDSFIDTDREITIILHREPDLDSLFSAYVLEKYLSMSQADFKQQVVERLLGDKNLMDVINQADEGRYDHEHFGNDYNIYYVLAYLGYLLGKGGSGNEKGVWEEVRDTFFRFLNGFLETENYAFPEYAKKYVERDSTGLKEVVEFVRNVYDRSISDTPPHYRGIFFREAGGRFEISWRKFLVIHIDEKIGVLFNVIKARKRKESDRIWIIHYPPKTNEKITRHRYVVSVDGNDRWGLFSYGWHLEALEKYLRNKLAGIFPLYPARTGPPRPGYHGPDPWYDGRGHNYTIVDSPNVGTILGEIVARQHELFKRAGGGSQEHNVELDKSFLPGFKKGLNFLDFLSVSHPLWPKSVVGALADYAEAVLENHQENEPHAGSLKMLVESIREYLIFLDKLRSDFSSPISSAELRSVYKRLTEIETSSLLNVWSSGNRSVS